MDPCKGTANGRKLPFSDTNYTQSALRSDGRPPTLLMGPTRTGTNYPGTITSRSHNVIKYHIIPYQYLCMYIYIYICVMYVYVYIFVERDILTRYTTI